MRREQVLSGAMMVLVVVASPTASAGGGAAYRDVVEGVVRNTSDGQWAWGGRIVTVTGQGYPIVVADVLQWKNRFRLVSVAVEGERRLNEPPKRVDTYCDGSTVWTIDHLRWSVFIRRMEEDERARIRGPLTPNDDWLSRSPDEVSDLSVPVREPHLLQQWLSFSSEMEVRFLRKDLLPDPEPEHQAFGGSFALYRFDQRDGVVPGLDGSLELLFDTRRRLPVKLTATLRGGRGDERRNPVSVVSYFCEIARYRPPADSVFTPVVPKGYRCSDFTTYRSPR